MERVVCFLAALTILLTTSVCSLAADAVVTRNATLRSDPSSKHKPIAHLAIGDDVELLASTLTNGYYHVRTVDGDEGWIYSKNVNLATPPAPSTPPTPPILSGTGGIASGFVENWDKPAPTSNSFQTEDGPCGPSGDGGDSFTNLRKNRVDVPSAYHEVTWKALQSLPYPVAAKSLDQWTQPQLQKIMPYEGVPVSVVGYIVKIKVEDRGSGESTNCHFVNADEVDWHVPFVEHRGDTEDTAVVVETTPRVRQSHPKWTPSNLSPWVNSQAPVRVSGWTLLDPEHRAHLGKYRSTLWEIHPITKIEVFKDGQWVSLDDLP
ncbi:MAG: SH3 domain-containing protein [Terriglobales bacterium]